MAVRVIITHFLLLLLLLLGISQVSSHSKVNNEEDQLSQLSQAFRVFTKGGNTRLLQDIALRFSNYFNPGGSVALAPAPAPAAAPVECGGLCKHRCSLHSRPKVCRRACGTCCVRCKCVPPGTSGNREMCGKCYTDMTTHGNRTKCP